MQRNRGPGVRRIFIRVVVIEDAEIGAGFRPDVVRFGRMNMRIVSISLVAKTLW